MHQLSVSIGHCFKMTTDCQSNWTQPQKQRSNPSHQFLRKAVNTPVRFRYLQQAYVVRRNRSVVRSFVRSFVRSVGRSVGRSVKRTTLRLVCVKTTILVGVVFALRNIICCFQNNLKTLLRMESIFETTARYFTY